jgi:two-component system sensor histidine kinase CpxA
LRSAIENVVRNATRYTAPGTAVAIRAEKRKIGNSDEAYVRVSDSGPGVPEVELEKIFQPFYRIDDARERSTGGVGLGLAITDQAIRLHGGSVRASNLPEGGLLVEMHIPLQSGQGLQDQRAVAVSSKIS